MCSLYSFRKSVDETRALLKYLEHPQFPPRDYVHPASPIAIVRSGLNGQRHFALVRWGFIPSWVKELRAQPLINARSETVYEKASFKNAIRRRRCLIPADGFYEWKRTGKRTSIPYRFTLKDKSLFALAGLWEEYDDENGEMFHKIGRAHV